VASGNAGDACVIEEALVVTDTIDAAFAYPACGLSQGEVMGTTGSSAGGGWVATRRGHRTVLIHMVGKADPNIRPASVRCSAAYDEQERATVRRWRMGTLRGLVSRVLWDCRSQQS